MKIRLFIVILAGLLPMIQVVAAEEPANGVATSSSAPGSTRNSADQSQVTAARGDDVLDLIVFGPTYPLRLRLHLEVNGLSFREAWRKSLEQSLESLTREADESYSPATVAAIAAKLGAAPKALLEPATMSAAAMKARRGFSRAEALEELYAIPPLIVNNKLTSRGAGAALFPLLDADGDGRLSGAELDAAAISLRCRDFNDDLLLTELELIQGPPRNTPQRGNAKPDVAEGVVRVVDPTMPLEVLVDSLLYRYDRNRDGHLGYGDSPAEIRFPTERYAKLIQKQDRRLDHADLMSLLLSPPDVELDFQLGRRSTELPRREQRVAPDQVFEVRRKLDGGYRLSLAGNEINLRRNNRDPVQASDPPRLRNYDQDNDGYLTSEELPPESGLKIALLDRDGNGKVTREEFDEYHRQQAATTAARIVLTVSDQGQDLFTLLDKNGDQVLAPRELLTARELLSTADANRDGFVSNFEVPYNITLEISRGDDPTAAGRDQLRQPLRDRQPKSPSAAAPTWFTRTDRNGDGELSPSEFLGPRESYDRLDTNHDGLLDPVEAAASQK